MVYRKISEEFAEDAIEEVITALADGQPMVDACSDARLPSVSTILRWASLDDDLSKRIARARETGYMVRAERAVKDAKLAADPVKGRLAFDAERWMLGKLSNAFSDDKKREMKLELGLTPEAAKWLGLS